MRISAPRLSLSPGNRSHSLFTRYLCLVYIGLLSIVEAGGSSGRKIIDTAKHAMNFEDSPQHRHRRDVSISAPPTLQSLLLDPKGSHLVEFDLILDDDQYSSLTEIGSYKSGGNRAEHRQKRKAVKHSIYHWPGAVVPYVIHSSVDSVSSAARHRIQKAMMHWERNTCIKFVQYNSLKHTNYVSIRKGQWCASKLGMAGGVQPLYVALGCLDTGTIIHELGHTIGWVHEQARPDRDDYITIKWSLVSASYKSQYVKHGEDFVDTFGVPYDYDSIMHYPSYGELITTDPSAQYRIGQRNRLSFYDLKLANLMYKCPERSGCDTSKLKCINGGFVDHTCQCVCPDGNSQSCTITNGKLKPYPSLKTTPSISVTKCETWKVYTSAFIPGNNDDVGFALSVDQCKLRCLTEKKFKCASFDYWKQRRQCYLSSSTASSLGIRFSHDSRMVHYELNDCTTKRLVTRKRVTTPTTTSRTTTTSRKPILTDNYTTNNTTTPNRKIGIQCPFEYADTGLYCIRALTYPSRPLHIAETECKEKLGATMWEMNEDEWNSSEVSQLVSEGEEYWVKVKNFKSDNVMASFFDFCPYITKESGSIVLKDTLCFKQKGFICQLTDKR